MQRLTIQSKPPTSSTQVGFGSLSPTDNPPAPYCQTGSLGCSCSPPWDLEDCWGQNLGASLPTPNTRKGETFSHFSAAKTGGWGFLSLKTSCSWALTDVRQEHLGGSPSFALPVPGEEGQKCPQRLCSFITCSGAASKSTNHTVLQAQLLQWLFEQVGLEVTEVTGIVFGLWGAKVSRKLKLWPSCCLRPLERRYYLCSRF